MRALVLLSLTSLHAAAVRLLDLPVNVEVQAFARLHLSMAGSCSHTRDGAGVTHHGFTV